MRRTSARRRTVLALSCVLVHAAAPALARNRRSVECIVSQDGPTSIIESTARVSAGGRRLTVKTTSSIIAGGDATVTMSAAFGKTNVLRSTFALSGSTVQMATDLGAGFKGIEHVELASTDGRLYAGQVDGRAVTASAAAGQVESLTFADGAPPPTLKVKRSVKRALTKAAKLAQGASCTGLTPAPQAFDSCDRCKLGCQFDPTESGFWVCAASTLASATSCVALTPLVCVVTFQLNGLACTTGYTNCEKACLTSDECCRVHCPGAVGQCCNGDGEVCCARDRNGGSCCTNCCGNPPEGASATCCGRRTPSSEERLCIDPAIGLCCEPSGTICGGNECCEPGASCCDNSYCTLPGGACCSTPTSPQRSFSCNAGFQCADPQANLCCPAGVAACNGVCCTGNQVCAPGNNTCCDPNDLCGDTCCPSHNCLNGTECCSTATFCGGHCAAPFGSCCNGQHCAGVCVGPGRATCCAADRECPLGGGSQSQCCPLNYTCQGTTCVACGCPDGEECCPGGTQGCCTPPNICCQPEGRPKGCYTVNDCLGLR